MKNNKRCSKIVNEMLCKWLFDYLNKPIMSDKEVRILQSKVANAKMPRGWKP